MTSVPTTEAAAIERLRAAVEEIEDPELPHVTIGDLGMVRSVEADVDNALVLITITPTYTGCPATEQIADDVRSVATALGWDATVKTAMAPAWTTDWITDRGRQRLRAAGISPPPMIDTDGDPTREASTETPVDLPVPCPRCGSRRTRRIAQFGSTACKASYVCGACTEPFDYFKPF